MLRQSIILLENSQVSIFKTSFQSWNGKPSKESEGFLGHYTFDFLDQDSCSPGCPWNFWSFHLQLLSAGIRGVHLHALPYAALGEEP